MDAAAQRNPADCWVAGLFAAAWSDVPPPGLKADRFVMAGSQWAEVEKIIRAPLCPPEAHRIPVQASQADLIASMREFIQDDVAPGLRELVAVPPSHCYAILEPDVFLASEIVCKWLASSDSAASPASTKKKRKSKARPGAVPGWTVKNLCIVGRIKRGTFADIRKAAGVAAPPKHAHGYCFTVPELMKLADTAVNKTGKRKWSRAGREWHALIAEHKNSSV
ncbi:MAG: hypothetical protein KF699_10595 [Phycisphaeraceae bacterium]|nr:hypothetical protein [Phycisphaeraceae bacterium]MBX3408210.1 hypothetical protein [Phycisphaeraceae bacterium]